MSTVGRTFLLPSFGRQSITTSCEDKTAAKLLRNNMVRKYQEISAKAISADDRNDKMLCGWNFLSRKATE